jgi:hypothetical protein
MVDPNAKLEEELIVRLQVKLSFGQHIKDGFSLIEIYLLINQWANVVRWK